MVKFQGLFLIISLALTLFAFVECAMREDFQVQKLPKWGWLLLIALLTPFGAIAYLIMGRNGSRQPRTKRPKPRILPPDDDPDFLGKL
jgi:hypothetical protein